MTAFCVPPTCCFVCVRCFSVRLFSHFVAHCPFHDLLAQNETNRRDISTETFTFTHIDCTTATMNPRCCRSYYYPSPTPHHTRGSTNMQSATGNVSCFSFVRRNKYWSLRPLEQKALLASRSSFLKTLFFYKKKPKSLLRALSILPFPTAGCAHFLLVRVNRE